MTIQQLLETQLQRAVFAVTGLSPNCPVVHSSDLRFGDYQSNVAMTLAKAQRTNPRALATEIQNALQLDHIASVEIAGPGFLNFRISHEKFSQQVAEISHDPKLGAPDVGQGQVIVIDFSSPNVAKPMHVGHIRSTILGDSLARIARFLGFSVITDNHIGDWGTQFGMILHGWKTRLDHDALQRDPIAELVRCYREVNQETKENPEILEVCKAELVKLQAGNEENLAIWQQCIELSKQGLQRIYQTLDVHFDHWIGESAYNDRLPGMVDELVNLRIARESKGAICIFSDGKTPDEQDPFRVNNEGWNDNPCLVRKADGGFLYASTDLATLEFRVKQWKADQIWYVVGVPQALHFRQIFAASQRWGFQANCQHVAFGSILGEDRKLMKTRSGDNVQLADVLQEAVERATLVVREKNPTLSESDAQQIAEMVGIGAVKFAELSQHRLTDYVFSWDRMLALHGDTAPYLQNSYVRIRSIFRKLDHPFEATELASTLQHESEINLARLSCKWGEILPSILEDHRPNILANYLLEVARAFHSFYEACPVLKSEGDTRHNRLFLCDVTAKILKTGLHLLGIQAPERM